MMNSTEDIATHSEQPKLDLISTSDNIPQVTIETISSLPNSDTNNKLSGNVDAGNKLSEDLPKERKVLSLIADPSSYYEMGQWGAFGRDGKLGFGGITTPRRTMSLTYKKQNSSYVDSGPALFTSELTRGLAKENHLNADDTLQESRIHQPLVDEISHEPTTLSPPSPLQSIYTKDVSDTSGVRKFFHHNRAHSYTPNASGASFPLEIPKRPISSNSGTRLFVSTPANEDDWKDFLDGYAQGNFDPLSIPKKPRRLSGKKHKDGSYKCSVPTSPLSEYTVCSDTSENYIIPGLTMVKEEKEFTHSPKDIIGVQVNDKWRFQILNTSQDMNFTRLVGLVKEHFKVPTTLISLVNTTHQWFKAVDGFGYSETPREVSFCGHAILQKDGEPLVVSDALNDWRFKKNPLVTNSPFIRFYAGAPLRTKDGHNVGTVCLIDHKPRYDFGLSDRKQLQDFARVVMRELELWADRLRLRVRNKMQQSIAEFSKFCLETQLAHENNSTKRRESTWVGDHSKNGDPVMQQYFDKAVTLIRETLEVDALYVLEMPSLSSRPITTTSRPSNNDFSDFLLSSPPPEPPTKRLRFLASYGLMISPDAINTLKTTSFLTHLMQMHSQGYIFQNALPPIPTLFPSDMHSGIVVPIFDNSKNAFGFLIVLTKDPHRQFEEEERVYLGNFGVNMVSEVLKRRVIVADRAKSAFISSISHELRTPLHGILASCELMAENPMNEAQLELLKTIKGCGASLISILNNVLDYAKLESSQEQDAAIRYSQSSPSGDGNLSKDFKDTGKSLLQRNARLKEKINLVKVLEDVAESCVAGQQMVSAIYGKNDQQLDAEEISTTATHSRKRRVCDLLSTNRKQVVGQNDVEVIIDCEYRERGWWVMSEDGAVRQMLMNIVGNALKFTQSGYVRISLTCVSSPSEESERLHVLFTITDTGCGIGSNFLTTHLFQPFAQEDPLQLGTGLGLSIVKLLVEKMGGRLDVESEVDVGTRVKIWLDFEETNSADNPESNEDEDADMRERKEKDRKAILQKFSGKTVIFKNVTGKLREATERLQKDWFGVKNTIFEDKLSILDGDFVIINNDLEALRELLMGGGKEYKKKSSWFEVPFTHEEKCKFNSPIAFYTTLANHGKASKIIEKMQNEIAMSSADNIGRRRVVVLSKPIGPHKMEAAILACFGPKDGVELDNNGSVSTPPQMLHSAPYDEIQHYHDNASSEDTSSPLETPILERTDPFDNVSSYSHFRTIPLFRSTTMPNIPPSTSPPPFTEKFLPIPNPRQQSSPGLSTSVPEMNAFPVPSISQRMDLRGPRILVVEDNAVNRMILSNFLKKRGIYFEEAENGAIGVEKYRKALEREDIGIDLKKGFDIIFMDIQMPVMNGNVATSEIRRIEKEYNERKGKLKKKTITEAIREFKVIPATTSFLLNSLSSAGFPSSLLNTESINTEDNTTDPSTSTQNRSLIFALTGLASDEDKHVAFESGVDGFLTKPVSLKTLDKVIKRWHELEEFATQIPTDALPSSMDTLNKDRIENEQETKDGKKEAQEQEEFRKKGIVSMCNC